MKLVFILSVALVFQTCRAESEESEESYENTLISTLAANNTCTAGTTCTPDCTGLRICVGTATIDVNCGVQTNGSRPYCNSITKSCDNNPDYCAVNGETECPLGAGNYPVLINCHKYYNCDKTLFRVNYDCGDKAVYNPVSEACDVPTKCLDFTPNGECKGNVPRLIAHPLRKDFYVICTGALPLLQKCQYEGYQFNQNFARCEFVCTKEGRFADMEDPEKVYYFECISNGGQFIQKRAKCQAGTIFDAATQACIKKKTYDDLRHLPLILYL